MSGSAVSIVVVTDVTEGVRGVDENPNRHGGSTGASDPRGSPSNDPEAEVTSRRSVAPYHSCRPSVRRRGSARRP